MSADIIMNTAMLSFVVGFFMLVAALALYIYNRQTVAQAKKERDRERERAKRIHEELIDSYVQRSRCTRRSADLKKELNRVQGERNRYKNLAQAIQDVMEASDVDLATVDMSKCYGMWSPAGKRRQVYNDFELKPGDIIQLDDGVKLRANSRAWFDVVQPNDDECGGKS